MKFIQIVLTLFILNACGNTQNTKNTTIMQPLNSEEKYVIEQKGTEKPFTGKYDDFFEEGTYVCRKCGAELYHSTDKFKSGCGWPSFDDEIAGAVKRIPDADGRRTEIQCTKCGAHLGHVFIGEYLTSKNTRHCVNSISLVFVPKVSNKKDTAYFASGCFWGTEYYFMKAPGVIKTNVGFMGGRIDNPTYKQVCTGTTGHIETTQVIFNTQDTNCKVSLYSMKSETTKVQYDTNQTSYENLLRLFFETHDFTQTDGQGPDIGEQYLSVIFYTNDEQKKLAEQYIKKLKDMGYKVATTIRPASTFWKAEDYHQQYYEGNGKKPYCHKYKKIF